MVCSGCVVRLLVLVLVRECCFVCTRLTIVLALCCTALFLLILVPIVGDAPNDGREIVCNGTECLHGEPVVLDHGLMLISQFVEGVNVPADLVSGILCNLCAFFALLLYLFIVVLEIWHILSTHVRIAIARCRRRLHLSGKIVR